MALSVGAGRAGDIWRLFAADQPVRIHLRTGMKVGYKPLSAPEGPTFGIGKSDWDWTLQRFREDLETLSAGSLAHIYVDPTDLYLLSIEEDEWKPSGRCWSAWRKGQEPEPEDDDAGFFIDPQEHGLDGELLYRPFRMLHDAEKVTDANGRHWTFTAPFWFTDEEGQRGSPVWPLTLTDDDRAAQLNNTSEHHEKAEWSARSGVGPEVFDPPPA